MLPYTGDFLLVGNLPPTCEGTRIDTTEGLLGIDNRLQVAALTQPPTKQYYGFYTSVTISRHAVSSQKMIQHVKKEDELC